MRKIAKASIGLLLIGSISFAQPRKDPAAFLCYVNGKNCTLEDISKILSGTHPSETKCECIGADNVLSHIGSQKVYRIFLEESNISGTLTIPHNVALSIEYAPYTTFKGVIVNEGILRTVVPWGTWDSFPLYFEGKIENQGKARLSLIPKKAKIINEGTLYIGTYYKPFFQIKSSPLFARLNRLKLYSNPDYIGEASIINKGDLRIHNFLRGSIESLRGSIETSESLVLSAPSKDIPAFEGTINISGGSVEISGYIRNTTINGDGSTLVEVFKDPLENEDVPGATFENVTCNGVFLKPRKRANPSFVNTNCEVR